MHNDDSTLVLLTDCADKKIKTEHVDDLEQLCKDEQNSAEEKSLDNSNLAYDSHKEEDKVAISEELSRNEAIESFISSFEKLMPYYTGKKSIGKIMDWIKTILRPLIDSFIKS